MVKKTEYLNFCLNIFKKNNVFFKKSEKNNFLFLQKTNPVLLVFQY